MITKDIAFAFRNIARNKLLATINILGLSIGVSACLIIFLIATYELGFDTFQPDRDRIYRIYSQFQGPYHQTNPGVPTALGVAVQEYFTGIESVTNFHTFIAKAMVRHKTSDTKDFGTHNKIIIASPDYFHVFDYYEWLVGNPEESLSKPFTVVLSESRANTYFGDGDLINVIGREVIYQDSLSVTVSGIVRDIQERTDFDFTDFISFSTVERSWLEGNKLQLNTWNAINSSSQLFIKVAEGTSPEKIQEQLFKLPDFYNSSKNEKWDDWRPIGKLQALKDLHFNSAVGIFDSSRPVMDKSTVYVLIGAAGLLLLIAVINFINLETAHASRKAREVGIRKVLGSSRQKLIFRFLAESFIVCLLAVLLAACLIKLSFNYFHDYIPAGLEFHLADPIVIVFLFSCVIGVTFMAGLYPALVISSYQPVLALKNLTYSNASASRSALVRKGLTIFQFSFSQIFLAGAVVIGLQLDYMVNKDLGFNPDAVVFLYTPSEGTKEQRAALRNELAQIPEIEAFGMHGTQPISNGSLSQDMTFNNGKEILEDQVYIKLGDTSYLRVYDIRLLAGRNFLPADSMRQLIINETYLHMLGFKDPEDAIGKATSEGTTFVGVVKDFHTTSLHAAIRPTAISYATDQTGFGIKLFTPNRTVSDLKPALSKIEAAWKLVYPDEIFRYSFMDDTIRRYYENEERTRKLAGMATVIALVISCLGLFGLCSFTVVQRTKEIGIRKVLGATVNGIIILLAKEFLILVAIALVLSTPLAYYMSRWWLEAFAYKIQLTVWVFGLTGMFSLIIALVTISFRTVNAAKADPVKSLRYE